PVGLREIRSDVDVGMIDDVDAIPLPLAETDLQQVLVPDVVGGPGVAGVPDRVLRVEGVLDVPARVDAPVRLAALADQDDSAALGGLFGLGLPPDDRELFSSQQHATDPPASAGMIE